MLAVGDHEWWWASAGVVGYCGGTGCAARKWLPSFRLTCCLLLSEITQVLLLVDLARRLHEPRRCDRASSTRAPSVVMCPCGLINQGSAMRGATKLWSAMGCVTREVRSGAGEVDESVGERIVDWWVAGV